MIKNPVFKVGDLVVYINDDYESPGMAWDLDGHLPIGAPLRICFIVRGYKGEVLGYDCKRISEIDGHEYGPLWYARRDEIHPAYDEP